MDKKVADSPMATALTGSQRRKRILTMMRQSSQPLSGGALGRDTGARGYILNETKKAVRLFKVCHTTEQISEELETIVDLGGSVEDVMVNHRAYGKMSAPLRIRNRRDVATLLDNLKTGKSTPLMNVTAGYHFHHVTADSQEILDEIEENLRQKHLLAEFLPYELEEESNQDIK